MEPEQHSPRTTARKVNPTTPAAPCPAPGTHRPAPPDRARLLKRRNNANRPDLRRSPHFTTLPWHRALIRTGFDLTPNNDIIFSLDGEHSDNIAYLEKLITVANLGTMDQNTFFPSAPTVDEYLWLNTIHHLHSGAEGGRPHNLELMDTFMPGLVRWLNNIGLATTFSCDGHNRRAPRIQFHSRQDTDIAAWLLNTPAKRFRIQPGRLNILTTIPLPRPRDHDRPRPLFPRRHFLDLAEWLHTNQDLLRETASAMQRVKSLAHN